MSTDPSPQNALEQFRDAAAANNLEKTFGLIDDVDRAIDQDSQLTLAVENVARGVLARTKPRTDAYAAAKNLVKTTRTAEEHRLEFGYWLFALTEGSAQPKNLVDPTTTVIEDQEQVLTEARQLRRQDTDVSLPAVIAATAPDSLDVPKGDTVEFDAVVENVGTAAIDQLNVSVQSDLSLSASPGTITSLPIGKRQTVTISGPAATIDGYTTNIVIRNDTIAETVPILIRVADKETYLRRAHEQVQTLQSRIENTRTDSDQGNGPLTGTIKKLEEIASRLDQLAAQAGADGPPEQALNNKIGAVINELGAVQNQINAQSGKALSEKEAAVFNTDVSETIINLKTAQVADG